MLTKLPELISNNTQTLRELLPNKSKHIFRVRIKHYWHFQGVTLENYRLFQTSNNTDISRELLANNTANFSRDYIKKHWHFQKDTGKQYYKLFQISYHYQPIGTFSESYYQTILTYSDLISNSIHFFPELLPSYSKHFFESFKGHLNRKKNFKQKIPK